MVVSVKPSLLTFESWNVRVVFASGGVRERKGVMTTELSTSSSTAFDMPLVSGAVTAVSAGTVAFAVAFVPKAVVWAEAEVAEARRTRSSRLIMGLVEGG